MHKKQHTYRSVIIMNSIAMVFMLFVILKPIVNTILILTDVAFELVETLDTETSEHQKEFKEDVFDKTVPFSENNNIFIVSKHKIAPSYNLCQEKYCNTALDIFLPPPERV